jgi:chromate transporter
VTTSGPPTLGAALGYWLKLGCLGFGGPAAQIAMMHRDLVLRLGWIDERQFLRALNYCLLLPGPEAQQLATYMGWRLHGVRGGMLSGGLFILPALIIITLIGWAYATHRNTGLVRALLLALNPAVIALLLLSLQSLALRVLTSRTAVLLALGIGALPCVGAGRTYRPGDVDERLLGRDSLSIGRRCRSTAAASPPLRPPR